MSQTAEPPPPLPLSKDFTILGSQCDTVTGSFGIHFIYTSAPDALPVTGTLHAKFPSPFTSFCQAASCPSRWPEALHHRPLPLAHVQFRFDTHQLPQTATAWFALMSARSTWTMCGPRPPHIALVDVLQLWHLSWMTGRPGPSHATQG